MADKPTLFSFRRCPYAMRARMALGISGVAFDTTEVSLRAKPPALLAASPKGTVPVLVLVDGTIIDESLDIMHWALAQNDPEGWLACDGDDAANLIAANDGPFKHALDRYKYPTRYSGTDPAQHRAAGLAILDNLNMRLSRQDYLNGATRTLPDIALFPFVRQFAATDSAWFAAQHITGVQRWLKSLAASDLFLRVMKII
jgi:glutathione S-transferase